MADEIVSILMYIGVIVILLIGGYAVGSYKCDYYGKATNRKVQFGFVNGCYVEKDGRWIPKDQIREVE